MKKNLLKNKYYCGCSKAYSYQSSLRKHIISKHGPKPLKGTY